MTVTEKHIKETGEYLETLSHDDLLHTAKMLLEDTYRLREELDAVKGIVR